MSEWSEAALLSHGWFLFGDDRQDDIGSALVGIAEKQGVAQRGWRGAASLRMAPPEGLQEFGPRLDTLDPEHANQEVPVDGQRIAVGDPRITCSCANLKGLAPRADRLDERPLDEEQHD